MAAASGTQAVGFGRVTPTAVLGQPLNVTVPLRLEPGERLFAECVAAEVQSGDSQLPPSQVYLQVVPGASTQDWAVRITTLGPIEEPVVEIAVSAGCEKRFMRRFTAFADPPDAGRRGSPLPAPELPNRLATLPQVEASPASGAAPVRAAPASRAPVAVAAAPAQPRAPRPQRVKPPADDTPAVQKQARSVPKVSAPVQRLTAETGDAQVARLLLDVGGPRLKMDMDEPLMRAPAGAVAAASLPPLGADDDLARLQTLEKSLSQLRKESQTAKDASSGMKARLAEAESRSRLLPWLLGLLLLVGGLAAWLGWRLRRQSVAAPQESRQEWWASGAAPLDSTGPVPEPPSSVAGELVDEPAMPPARPAASQPAWVAEPEQPEPAIQKTATLPGPVGFGSISGGGLDPQQPVREVSVEELLDLEQQADFFIALGQEDAAVDLLMSHLRGSGGLSPLPYTKLLEIYKRQGDRGAYERIRARFNRRFNAYAPDWDVGPMVGRALEDYPDVVLYLQSIWPSPLDAMAVLEGMLFRKDESQEMFDLPAYKDVLLLYSLARDLWQQGGTEVSEVDVLLPLGETGPTPLAADATLPLADAPAYDLTAFELEPQQAVPPPSAPWPAWDDADAAAGTPPATPGRH